MTGLEIAKERLLSGGHTCVILSEGELITSDRRGVAPLVSLISKRGFGSLPGAYAADKVAGKATAFLYLILGISEIYAKVISRSAHALLAEHGVKAEYCELTDHIINRSGDGICPFEEAVLNISDEKEAFSAILTKIHEMNIEI